MCVLNTMEGDLGVGDQSSPAIVDQQGTRSKKRRGSTAGRIQYSCLFQLRIWRSSVSWKAIGWELKHQGWSQWTCDFIRQLVDYKPTANSSQRVELSLHSRLGPYKGDLGGLRIVCVEIYPKAWVWIESLAPPFLPQGCSWRVWVTIGKQNKINDHECCLGDSTNLKCRGIHSTYNGGYIT